MLYVPLDFENGLTVHAPVDSGACFRVIAQIESDRIKKQAPTIGDSPKLQNDEQQPHSKMILQTKPFQNTSL